MAATPRITIRTATPDDAAEVGVVHVRAWEAYRGLLRDDFLDRLDPVARGHRWHERLVAGGGGGRVVDPHGDSTLLVAELEGRVVGICDYGRPRDADGGPVPRDEGELWMINVLPEAWGTGVAQPLLDAAIEGLTREGYREAVLWVLEGNARARRFYERNGWVVDGGSKRERFGDAEVLELRYRLRLTGENAPR